MNSNLFDIIDARIEKIDINRTIKKRKLLNSKRELAIWERFDVLNAKASGLHNIGIDLLEGDIILKNLKTYLNSFKTRSKQQIIFHEVFTQANYHNIYGKDFEKNELRIKKASMIDVINPFALVCCPRRMGKTKAVAMWVAAFMLAFPKAEVVIISPSKRQSQMMSDEIKTALQDLLEAGHYFEKGPRDNNEIYTIKKDGTIRTVKNLGSNPETARGIGGDVIICEEAAALDVHFFLAVVAPVLQRIRTSLIALTTIRDSDNYINKLDDLMNDDGTKFFRTFKFYNSCEACRKNGITTVCEHNRYNLPSWISGAKISILKNLYIQLGQEELLAQEIGNQSSSNTLAAFNEKKIKELFAKPPVDPENEVTLAFMAIDPCGGSKKASDLSVVSGYWDDGRMVICGLESISASYEWEYLPQVVDHLKALKRLPQFQYSKVCVIMESNLRIQAGNIIKAFKEECPGDFVVMKKDGYDVSNVKIGSSMGLNTDPVVKENLYKCLDEMLTYNCIRFNKHMVSEHNRLSDPDRIEKLKSELKKQLFNYAIINKAAKDPEFDKVRRMYSGKRGGKKDDLCMGLQLMSFWSKKFIAKKAAELI